MNAAMKKLVSARLQAEAAGPHPAPELLAAYTEKSLSPHDRDTLLTHLAACADCRDALYLALPEVDTQPVRKPSYKAPRLAVRWGTLAASVVILGAVLLTNRAVFYQHSPGPQRYTVMPSAAVPSKEIAELKEPAEHRPAATRGPAMQATAKVNPPLKHMTAKPQASMRFDQSDEVHLASPQAVGGAMQASAARVRSDEFALDKNPSRFQRRRHSHRVLQCAERRGKHRQWPGLEHFRRRPHLAFEVAHQAHSPVTITFYFQLLK